MKSRTILLLIILSVIVCVVGGLAIYQKKFFEIKPETILKELLSKKSYHTDITYIVKNARGQFKEEGKLEYNKGKGVKLILADKEQIFEDEKITINYLKDNKTYYVNKDYDNFYKYMFINDMHKYMNYENNVNYLLEEAEGKKTIKLEFFLLSGNDNFYKEVLLVDANKKVPIKAIIYDKKDEERIVIEYNNFTRENH